LFLALGKKNEITKTKFLKRVNLREGDIRKFDVSDATVVFVNDLTWPDKARSEYLEALEKVFIFFSENLEKVWRRFSFFFWSIWRRSGEGFHFFLEYLEKVWRRFSFFLEYLEKVWGRFSFFYYFSDYIV